MEASPPRPDPDALLARLSAEESRAKRGHLKLFLGMCPGVGKTYDMLRTACQEQSSGVSVLVGLVETHGRVETEALLQPLTILPRKEVPYRGTVLREMDLEAILARRPKLVLVDELAHTNAPGCRHAKRWQDVVELLEAGLDVFTTVNIQHIESRADAVQQITGAPVHETVPDSVLDLADEIELVDITPENLRERLQEGKVYLGERAVAAGDGFFKEANLIALRELALRYMAERMDRQAREMRAGDVRRVVWRSGERLLVAVAPSPFSTQLVRWTRRMSAALGAPWVAVHVDSSRSLAPDEQKLLDKNLTLARELGAEVIVTRDDDVPAALIRVALECNATQIVVGKPRGSRWLELLRGGSLVDRLVRLGGNIDIYLVPAEHKPSRRLRLDWANRSGQREYLESLGVIAGLTLAGLLSSNWLSYHTLGFLYLLAVIGLSLRVGRGPVLFAGLFAATVWNYLFIPPRFTLIINSVDDILLFFATVAVSLVAGQLTARIRAQARNERVREVRATALFQLTRSLAEASTLDEAVFAALRQADDLFGAQTTLALVDENNGTLAAHYAGSYPLDEKERGVAEWAFRNRRTAGRFTDTLPGSAGYYTPLLRENNAVGVLGVKLPADGTLTLGQRDLLDAFARQLALVVEHELLRAAGEREKLLAESDKLHRSLLDSVSHELRTPLAVITSALDNLTGLAGTARDALLDEARTATRRLNRLVGNLLDQTRLESGTLKPRLDWCDARDLVNAALEANADALAGHPVKVAIADDLPSVRADFTLTEQALANLLNNAAQHTPAGTPIAVEVHLEPGSRRVAFTVVDSGHGFPAGLRETAFRKFIRGPGVRPGGLGLGLSIVQGFIAAQGGEVILGENPGGGATITLFLPHHVPENSSPE
jgi:two-component system, OmpR family, sensor histidine kinase KdpD